MKGSATGGTCTWLDGSQLKPFAAAFPAGPATGRLSQTASTKPDRTHRACHFRLPNGDVVSVGISTFASPGDLAEVTSGHLAEPEARTKVPGRSGWAEFYVSHPSGSRWAVQDVSMALGPTTMTAVVYMSERVQVTKVNGKNVPSVDLRPALLTLHDEIFS